MSVVHSEEAILLVQEEHRVGAQAGHLVVTSESHIYIPNIWKIYGICMQDVRYPLTYFCKSKNGGRRGTAPS